VYPFVAINNKGEWPNTARVCTASLTLVNAITLYSAFAMPIWSSLVMSFLCHPLVLVPSLSANYVMYHKYKVLYFGDRSRVINMYLKPSGKQIIVETQDGKSKEVETLDIYMKRHIKSRYEDRIEFGHGANVFCFIQGTY
jgi:hypothetical protein